MNYLYSVIASCNNDVYIKKYEIIKETEKQFKIKDNGSYCERTINKSSLMNIDRDFLLGVFCYEEQINDAINLLILHYDSNIEALQKRIDGANLIIGKLHAYAKLKSK